MALAKKVRRLKRNLQEELDTTTELLMYFQDWEQKVAAQLRSQGQRDIQEQRDTRRKKKDLEIIGTMLGKKCTGSDAQVCEQLCKDFPTLFPNQYQTCSKQIKQIKQ